MLRAFNFSKFDFKKLFTFFGPAYLIGIGYMDPGNWATDLAGGSTFEYKLVWVLFLSNLLALFLQNLSTRFGIITGIDLASASRKYYNSWINFILYILAELAITACDLAEIIGMAIGLKLLFGIPLIWGIYITFLDTFLILFLVGKKMKRLEIFIIGMISLISFSFLVELFLVKLHWVPILKGLIPGEIHGEALFIALGIIGATVMPHNLYLHSFLVSHNHKKGDTASNLQSTKFAMWDTGIALNIAFFVNLAILILAASAFYSNGYNKVAELEDAHRLLKQILGSTSSTLFGIALLASGQSSTITGTLAGQVIMEGYLNIKLKPWVRRLITRSLALVPATLTIHFAGANSLNGLLIISQIVLSLQLCFAIIPLLHFNSFKSWMGDLALSLYGKIIGWIIVIFIISINAYYLVTNISGFLAWKSGKGLFLFIGSWLGLLLGLILLIFLILEPIFKSSGNKIREVWLVNEIPPMDTVSKL
jgi:manganese transport protein